MVTGSRDALYNNLADDLFQGRITETDCRSLVSVLPLLDETLLENLALEAEQVALREPRLGWALAKVAYETSLAQKSDLFLRSLAAWYLARACNQWAQPARVNQTIAQAQHGFERLEQPGWLAACDWQLNALAWTRPSFTQAVETLAQAAGGLDAAGFTELAFKCRLDLSYAQILVGQYDAAQAVIQTCQAHFDLNQDPIHQARCLLNQASLLRRRSQYDEALASLDQAVAIFEAQQAPVEVAKAQYQLALVHLFRTDDLAEAIYCFEHASHTFAVHGLDLWQAACLNNLGSIYMQSGRLSDAERHYRLARRTYEHQHVVGLLADSLNDSGKLNILRGNPQESIAQLKQALALHETLGARHPKAVELANLGEAYGALGRYQDALSYLEQAVEQLSPFEDYLRLGTCEKYAAVIWAHLGQYPLAHQHLDRAAEYYQRTRQRALLSSIATTRATIYFDEEKPQEALACLRESLSIAEKHGTQPQAALSRRLLGEALQRIGQTAEARPYLQQALSESAGMGMETEQIASLIALGNGERGEAPSLAKQHLFEALALCGGVFPELEWRADVGLAALAEDRGNLEAAVKYYHLGSQSLARVRFNLWQPSLVGSYQNTSADFIEKAVLLEVQAGRKADALQLIEENKATSLLVQLLTSRRDHAGRESQESQNLRAEILWIQDQLRSSFEKNAPLQSIAHSQALRTQLSEKIKHYNSLVEHRERGGPLHPAGESLSGHFDVEAWRELANRHIAADWLALDYQLLPNRLMLVVLSPLGLEIFIHPLSERVTIALRECLKACQRGQPAQPSDLEVLGDWLLPQAVLGRLSPQTVLVLSPHKKLHGLPWAALKPHPLGRPLAEVCIPVVVPSLNNLAALWARSPAAALPDRHTGLLVGLSKFEKYPTLRYSSQEVADIRRELNSNGVCLSESAATWAAIQALVPPVARPTLSSAGLARFAWFHLASHIFADPFTGRLGGMAFADGDVVLDQLRDVAPLPGLVTFSACNGIFSYRYEGDEPVGLATTCLIAGATQVVGSIGPVEDRASAEFMQQFYRHYFKGAAPAEAVVKTQRQMIAAGSPPGAWASFICLGRP